MKIIDQKEMRQIFIDLCDKIGKRAVAKKLGISQGYVSHVYLGRREISENIASVIGYRRKVIFEKKYTK